MKILYDHQAFTGMRYGGIARYHFELMKYFYATKDADFELALKFSNNQYIDQAKFSNHQNFTNFLTYLTTNRVMSFLNRANSSRILRKGDFDVFHPTLYNKYFLNHVGNKPFVLTFHDCTNEKFHDKFSSLGGDLFDLKQELLNKAARVITVSEHAKNDMLNYFKVDSDKIDVIHHATAFNDISLVNVDFKKIESLNKSYLLYVGNRSDFKNFNFYLSSISPILNKYKDLLVICAGGNGFNKIEKELINNLGLTDRVKFEEITDDYKLKALYSNALAFVFPSLNEGFGIPILEAMSSSCPMILSNSSCFPEIANDAAIYFSPTCQDSICEATQRIIEDENIRQILVNNGRKRFLDFSLKKTAQLTVQTYKNTIQQTTYVH